MPTYHVPVEITEMILKLVLPPVRELQDEKKDTFIPSDSEKTMLSNFALVAPRWRHLVNARRFLSLSVDNETPTSRVHLLEQIITTRLWSIREGIAQHCHEFSFGPDSLQRIYDLVVSGAPDHRTNFMACILNRLFPRDPWSSPAARTSAKVVRNIFYLGPPDINEESRPQYSFLDLQGHIQSCIYGLIINPDLTCFHISNMRTYDIMACPPLIPKLYLSNVTFIGPPGGIPFLRGWDFSNLTVLKLDKVSQFMEVMLPALIGRPFNKLEHLILSNLPTRSTHFVSALYLLGSAVKDITVEHKVISNVLIGNSMKLNFSHFPRLETLQMIIDVTLRVDVIEWSEEQYDLRSDLLGGISELLPRTIPSKLLLIVQTSLALDLGHILGFNSDLFIWDHDIGLADAIEGLLQRFPRSQMEMEIQMDVQPFKMHSDPVDVPYDLKEFEMIFQEYLRSDVFEPFCEISRLDFKVVTKFGELSLIDDDTDSTDSDNYSFDSKRWEDSETEDDDESEGTEENGTGSDNNEDSEENSGENEETGDSNLEHKTEEPET